MTRYLSLAVAVAVTLGALPARGQQPLALRNPGFERPGAPGAAPEAWGRYVSAGTARVALDETTRHGGERALRVELDKGSRCTVTQLVAVPEGGGYSFGLWLRTALADTARAYLYLQWHDAAGATVLNDRPSRALRGQSDWTEVVAAGTRPEKATSVLCVLVVEAGAGEGGTAWADEAWVKPGLLAPAPTAEETAAANALLMPVRPDDGRTVLQDPPDFSWNPQAAALSYELQLSAEAAFPAAATFTARTPYNVYSHSRALGPGKWYWRVRSLDKQEKPSEWFVSRCFTVGKGAQPFAVPPADELLGRIPTGHPRVYATAASLAAFRAPLAGAKKQWWADFQGRLAGYLARPVDKEPPADWRLNDRPGGGSLSDEDIERGNKLRGYCDAANSRLQGLAFGYLLSGERRYAEAAIAQLMEMATWDPKGVTSYKNHDQVFRDIAWMSATAYDWCWELMTPEQRRVVGQSVLVRARELYADFQGRSRPIYAAPYDSHGITAYGYLGICAIALAHESPEADEWFRFVAATYPAVFPPWGGEEGGWSQGVGYWKWSQGFAWWFFDALRSATGLDLYQKAFCRNTGSYKLYFHPPWCDRHHFGDGNHGAPDAFDQSNMARLATAYHNPYYQWYARHLPGSPSMGIYGYWWFDDAIPARPPADLPQGMYLPDIGWVAMHSDLSDPDDIMLLLKSSPFGSYNHSHADQNSFVVYGYGEPLLIDSGYYDWYGSPHDVGFTRQTKAHNDVLVDGEGQPIFDKTAGGEILSHFSSPAVDYAVGEAGPAYKGKLTSFRRHVVYLRPEAFLVIDQLEAPQPALFTWMLHAENEMRLEPGKQEVTVSRGSARCLVKFLTPQGLKFEQTDQFTPPSTRKLANEWHTAVSTTEKSNKATFVTFIRPCRATEPPEALEVKSQVQDSLLMVAWGTEARPGGVIAGWLADSKPSLTVIGPWREGAVAAAINTRTVDLKDGQGEFRLLDAESPLTATLELKGKDNASAEARRVTYQAAVPVQVALRVREAVKTLTLDGTPLSAGRYRWSGEKLSLQLPAGDHVLQVNPPAAPAAGAGAQVILDGQPLKLELQTMQTYTGGTLSWGSLEAPALPVTVEKLEAPPHTTVSLGTQPLREGDVVWPGRAAMLTLRGDAGAAAPVVRLRRLVTNTEPLAAPVVAAPAETVPGAVKLEAEAFTASGGGTPSRYTNRPFLSGGVGLGAWTLPGMWVQWRLQVPQAGRYRLLARSATHEPFAERLVAVDGKPLGGGYRVLRVATTGGYGAEPAQWGLVDLTAGQTLSLSAGEHTLQMTCVSGLLNLDYLVLAPQ